MTANRAQRFSAGLRVLDGGRREVPLPFDPAKLWGPRDRYHVTGTVDGNRVRGPLAQRDGSWVLPVVSNWCQQFVNSREVDVEIALEGPQRGDLAPDIAAALDAEPGAAAFFDSLATFYRTGYLRWVDATKRRPDVRVERINEMVALLKSGHKERPR